MKFVLIVLVLLLVYLLYPFHELWVKEDPFSDTYSPVARGFWSEKACISAAQAQLAEDYRCRQRSTLSRMLRSASDYGHGQGRDE